jgi:hypothetical protein
MHVPAFERSKSGRRHGVIRIRAVYAGSGLERMASALGRP